MATLAQISKNITALKWYAKNYNNAEDFSGYVGNDILVDVEWVFPNLRNEEFENITGVSCTDGNIEVVVDANGRLIIEDGHHRFQAKLIAGIKQIRVNILGAGVFFGKTFDSFNLSDSEIEALCF